MKKLLQVPSLADGGLNTDILAWDLPANVFTFGANYRVINSKIKPFGGWKDYVEMESGMIPGFVMYVRTDNGDFWIVCGEDDIHVYDTSSWYDIGPGGINGTQDEDLWHGCKLATTPILNHPNWFPLYWDPQLVTETMKDLPFRLIDDPENPGTDIPQTWQEAGERCRIMRSHKQWLFALDLSSVTIGDVNDGVRWSVPADIGSVPETWDHLDTTNTAGLTRLGGAGGLIIDGLSLRDAFVVYREFGISVFDYIPNSPYVFRIRHQSTTFGNIAPDSIVEVKGVHYFIADGDIFANDGNSIKSIVHKRIAKFIRGGFSGDAFRKAYTVVNNAANEVWFCLPSSGATHPDTAFIFNWRDDSWAVREVPKSPMSAYGKADAGFLPWDTYPGAWDKANAIWNSQQATPLGLGLVSAVKPNVVGVTDGGLGKLVLVDVQVSAEVGQYETKIERQGFPLDGMAKVTTITSVYPHADGPGGFWIRLGSMDFPGSPIRWKPAVFFNPETMRKVDIRTTGELHCYQIYDNETDLGWEFSGMDIEYAEAGLR